MQAINPATDELLREYPDHTADDVRQRIGLAAEAFRHWRRTPFSERSDKMRRAAEVLRNNRDDYARLITEEMGKPISQSQGEVEKCAWVCDFYAENAEQFLAPREIETDAKKSLVRYDPLGPVLAIMPWNFPMWQVFRFAAPGLMAGNVGLLKHASNVPGTALKIEEIFRQAGFPEGAFSTLLVSSKQVPEILENDAVRAATLTGSVRAGKSVGQEAGKRIKKSVLELGGSDPFLVLADADLTAAAEQAAKARTINSGQSCIAAKRFIVEAKIADQFRMAFVEQTERLKVGDPLDPQTDVGPLAREDLRESLEDQVRRSLDAGANLACGGRRLDQRGYYYQPTVLTEVEPGMAAFDEETFGPLAALVTARDADHAIQLANQSNFGLGASLWTGDFDRGLELASEIEAGCVFINSIVKSDPRLPFGGVKNSGYGRELADVGIREFVNVKTVSGEAG